MNNGFLNWISQNISYCDSLTQEELSELKYYYDKKEEASLYWDKVTDMAFKHNRAGIDYSTDFEKARISFGNAVDQLNNYKKQLDINHGIISEEKTVLTR